MKVKTAFLVGILDVGFLAAAILVTHFMMHGDMRIHVIGFACAGLNIVMHGPPLAAMKTVVTTKSVEDMPFLLSFLFLNGGIWTFYAVLVKDYFLGVPNGIGFIFGTVQLVLYGIYKKSKPSNSVSDDLEDGRQREHLLPSLSVVHGNSEG
ncbi:hypothetical protein L1049_019845 [Liquidambar formosana]|uniref:Uncharacterized protein n=1 Tax=Liquidambar formosana TaxID=63359 RepID=A0AAP0X387_LIQFO